MHQVLPNIVNVQHSQLKLPDLCISLHWHRSLSSRAGLSKLWAHSHHFTGLKVREELNCLLSILNLFSADQVADIPIPILFLRHNGEEIVRGWKLNSLHVSLTVRDTNISLAWVACTTKATRRHHTPDSVYLSELNEWHHYLKWLYSIFWLSAPRARPIAGRWASEYRAIGLTNVPVSLVPSVVG